MSRLLMMTEDRPHGASIYFPGPRDFPEDLRVLVVDRGVAARTALREALMRIGLRGDRIAMAEDIPSALFVYHVFHPTVVLTDADIPSGKGTNLARELLKLDPRLRFIALSSLPRIHPKVQSLMFNRAFAVVQRPVGDNELRDLVRAQSTPPEEEADHAGRGTTPPPPPEAVEVHALE